ncbi:peptide-methionine (S)-S-oxide reductase MsrA [candidate division WWE3 bacterium]|uniref:Peptide methionine sulfoxide reductase MsrA n=1 Tax=candidate division WWE3 bacterium TaxID=2053526 RepID=A0A955LKL7_UNCKA|nr:peptide-methionine (S)-S-oxide reductase MsrA [candidate division WWE3 bacterium]
MQDEQATFGMGCFWCSEAIFQRLRGVKKVVSGYAGGEQVDPDYEQVATGRTGYVECVQISFDPEVISYAELLDVFWHLHDPTQADGQGNDIGSQYRSVIFYHSDEQKDAALTSKKQLEKDGEFAQTIATGIEPFAKFYPAEDYHQNYYNDNQDKMYCKLVIDPKIKKLIEKYSEKMTAAPTEP